MKICNIIVANFILVILVLWIAFCLFFPEQIPTFTFTAITAGFAYQAYRYTKEKFRLELFEKRWEVYESTIKFLGYYSKHGTLKVTKENKEDMESAWESAAQSFRGIGYHKYKLLFGKDIHMLFKQVNEIFGYEATFSSSHDTQKWLENATFLTELSSNMPTIFAPYLYFGDYKYNSEDEINLCDLCALCSFKIENMLGSTRRKDETNVSTS